MGATETGWAWGGGERRDLKQTIRKVTRISKAILHTHTHTHVYTQTNNILHVYIKELMSQGCTTFCTQLLIDVKSCFFFMKERRNIEYEEIT